MEIISELSNCPNTDLVLISGRDKTTLQNWFGDLNIALIAEHGVWNKKSRTTGSLLTLLIIHGS